MDFRNHLFNRREVVALFIDWEASLLETDLALPLPAHTGSSASPGSEENLTSSSGYTPPQTRYEVIREAVRSFLVQKERALPNLTKWWLALYTVSDEVVELVPPTPFASGLVEAVMKQYLPVGGCRGVTPIQSTFPFRMVSTTLKHVEERCVETRDVYRSPSPTGGMMDVTGCSMLYGALVNATNTTTATSEGVHDFTVVQGIVFLSRTSGPPRSSCTIRGIKQGSPIMGKDGWANRRNSVASPERSLRGSSERWLDVVCLGPLSQSSSLMKGQRERQGDTQSGGDLARGTSGSMPLLNDDDDVAAVDVPCLVLDPVKASGVPHRGLAVGATLTKLLALSQHHNERYWSQPAFTVDLPTFETPSPSLEFMTAGPSRGPMPQAGSGQVDGATVEVTPSIPPMTRAASRSPRDTPKGTPTFHENGTPQSAASDLKTDSQQTLNLSVMTPSSRDRSAGGGAPLVRSTAPATVGSPPYIVPRRDVSVSRKAQPAQASVPRNTTNLRLFEGTALANVNSTVPGAQYGSPKTKKVVGLPHRYAKGPPRTGEESTVGVVVPGVVEHHLPQARAGPSTACVLPAMDRRSSSNHEGGK